MATIINADTSDGLKLTSDTSGEIKLQSAGTDIVSVTANGMAVDTNTLYVDATSNRVGIGESNPIAELHITDSAANAVIRLESADTGNGTINFDDQSAANQGRFLYDHSNNSMQFYTVATERMRIDSDGNLKFNSGYGSVATAYGCRAWVNFNGTGTVAIRASGNVSSITDNGTGDYTVNFTTALSDANYSAVATSGNGAGGRPYQATTTPLSISSLGVIVVLSASYAYDDALYNSVAIFR